MKSIREPAFIYGPPFGDKSQHAAMPPHIGKRIRKLRVEMGLTYAELSKLSRVPASTIAEYEQGRTKKPSGETVVKLAAALQVNVTWLQTGEGNPMRQEEVRIDETELGRLFKLLSPANKEAVLATAKALLGSQTGQFPAQPTDDRPRPPKRH